LGWLFLYKKNDLVTYELATISALAVIPATTGMVLGQRVRKSLSEYKFRKIFFISIFVLGGFIITKSALSFC